MATHIEAVNQFRLELVHQWSSFSSPLFDRIFKQWGGGTQASSQILAAQRNFDEFDVISYRKPYKNDVFEVFSMKKRQIFSRLRRAVVKSHQNLV